jgi:hypothetical protein
VGTVLSSSPWSYDLTHTDDGRLILTVVCGTVGLYELSLELDATEVACWTRDGEPYIRDLAATITRQPSQFWHRHVGGIEGQQPVGLESSAE